MTNRKLFICVTIFVVAALIPTANTLAQNIFRNDTTTAEGYATWDSDMINVEKVSQTGAGVYVAVLDTGLVPNWRDYFPKDRIATNLGTGFQQPVVFSQGRNPCELDVSIGRLNKTSWVGSTGSTHGTHVTSTIVGYFYRSNSDAAADFPLPPIAVRGIAPNVTIIPVKVLADYQIPALPQCTVPGPTPAQNVVFGTDEMIAAGIDYVTDLALTGYRPMVINMSLGGDALSQVEKDAIDRAIANGVIVVAAAGNEGDDGMGYPGAYAPVISAGASGWTKEWLPTSGAIPPRYRLWWLQSNFYPFYDVPEPTPVAQVYVTNFSSRELSGQQLDVLAPGSWVRGPFPGDPGYSHLPWWSRGIADLLGHNRGNFYYVGGTSMASPHVASAAALILQKNPALTQAQVETILKSTALPIPPGSAMVYDLSPVPGFYTYSWDADATGAGLLQVDAAVAATP
jgi:subtilisin family serine protease